MILKDNVTSDARYRYVDPPDVSLKNLDLTTKGGFYVSEASNDTDENGITSTFTVRLSSQPGDNDTSTADNVTITVSVSDSTEAELVSDSSLVFTESNWNAAQTVTVRGIADNLSDGDQSYTVILKDNVTSDARYRYVDPPDVSLKNLDLTTKGGFYVSEASNDTDENGITSTFTVRLSSQPGDNDTSTADNVTITVSVSDSTEAELVSDSSLVFTESNWNAAQTVTVRGIADNLSDGDQSYTVILKDNVTSDARYRYVDPPDVSLKNLDLTTKGGFYVSEASNDTDENGITSTFTVRLSSQPGDNDTSTADNVTITVSVSDSTEAELVSDSSLVFTESNWNAAQTVTVRGIADNLSDGDQSYTVILKDNVTSDARYRYVDPPDVSLKNLDLTTKGGFYVSEASNDTDENGITSTFTVRLSSQPGDNDTSTADNVTITVSVSDSTEAELVSDSSLVFTESNWNAAQTVTVRGIADNLSDGDQSYTVILKDNVTSDARYRYVDPPDVSLKNLDLTTKGGFYVSEASNDTDENGITSTFTVRLSSQPGDNDTSTADNVTITVSVSDSTEAELVSDSSLVFTESNWNAAQTVTVRGIADNLSDGDQSYTVILKDNVTSDARYRYVDPPDVSLKNLDLTTKGGFYVSEASNDTDENGITSTFTVRLSSQPGDNDTSTADNVTITVSVSDSTEAELVSDSSLVFTESNWNAAQTVTVRGIADNLSDGDQSYTVILKDNVTSDARYRYVDPPDVSLKNLDLTTKGGFYVSEASNDTDENGITSTFTVRLSSQPGDNDTSTADNVTITVSVSDSTEAELVSDSSLVFTESNWNAAQTVTVRGIADNLSDGDQSYTVILKDNVTSDARYRYVDPPDVSLKNLDLTTKGGFYVSEASNDTDENGITSTFTVRLSSQPGDNDTSTADNVTITVSVSDSTEAELVSDSSLVFTESNWNAAQTVTVRGIADNLSDGDQSYTVILKDNVTSDARYRYVDPPDVSLKNLDLTTKGGFYVSEASNDTDENGITSTFTVRLSSQPGDNDTSTADNVTITVSVSDSTEAELVSDSSLVFTESNWNAAQTVTVRGIADNLSDGDQSYTVILKDNVTSDARYRYVDPPDVSLKNLDLTTKGGFYVSEASNDTDENGITSTFTVRLSSQPGDNDTSTADNVTITVSVSDSTEAELVSDSSLVFTESNWNAAQTVTVRGIADNLSDGDQSYTVILKDNVTSDARYRYVDPPDVSLKNLDLTTKGGFYVSEASNDTDENGITSTFTVRLSSQPGDNDTSTADNVTITVSVSDSTEAELVSDSSLVFTESNWNAAQTVTVRGLADNLSDGDQSYTVILKDNVTSDARYRYVDPPDVSLKNLDLTTKGGFYVSEASNDTDENGITSTFTVRLSSQPGDNDTSTADNVTITVSVSDSTEAELVSDSSLVFTESNWNAAQTVTVRGIADNLSDGDQSYTVILKDNVTSDARYRYVDPPDVSLKNLDLTTKGGFYVSEASNDTDENGITSTFTVRLSSQPGDNDTSTADNVTITVSVSDSTEAELVSDSSLVFTESNWNAAQTVTVRGLADNLSDGDQSYTVILKDNVTSDARYRYVDPPDVSLKNLDLTTKGGFYVSEASNDTDENGITSTFTVRLSSQPGDNDTSTADNVTITVSVSDSTEAELVSDSSLVFTESNWNAAQTVTVRGLADNLSDGDQSYTVILKDNVTSDARYRYVDPPDVSLKNLDLTTKGGFYVSEASNDTDENGITSTFTVRLSSQPGDNDTSTADNVTITVSVSDSTEAELVSDSSLVFTESNWNAAQTVTVRGIADNLSDGDQSYTVILKDNVTSDARYRYVDPPDVSLKNLDLTTKGGFYVSEASNDTDENGITSTFTVRLSSQPGDNDTSTADNVTITVSVSDSTEAELVSDSSLVFTESNWNAAQTVTVRGLADNLSDGDQSYTVILKDNVTSDARYRYVDPPDVSLKNLDLTTKGGFYVSEASNDTDENGITSTFTVRLSSQPGDNDTSTADNVTITVSVSDSTEAELVSDSSLVFTESNWNAAQTVTVRGLADNLSDGDQSYTVILKDNVTSDARYRYVDPPDVSLKNLDLTTKGGFYVSEASNDTDENGITSTFTVRLSSQPGDNDTSTADNVTITVSVSDSTEAELVSDSSLVFTESNWNAAQTVTVRGIADNLSDGDQSYTVILKDNVTSDARYRYVDPPDVSLKNLDLTTKGGFYVSEASNDTDENGITSTFTVRLSSQPGDNDTSTADNVTITVSVSDSTEAELVSDSSLVFTESNWNAAQTVTVRGIADNLSDGDQSYTVILKDNVTSDARYRYVDPPDVSLKNLDLTTKGGFYVSEASNDTDENGITSTFTVRLSSQPGDNDTSTADNVTITVSVSDSTEAELVSDSSLVFTESNWNAAQTVTVRGLADNLSDGDQSYTVILKDNVTSDARYRYVDPPDVSLKNLDLTTKGGFYVSEASNDTDENGITSTFTVRLSSQPGDNDTSTADNVTITVSVSDSTEAELVSDSSLVFTESNWNAAQTVTVRGIADNLSDGDQSYTVILKDNVTSDARYRYVDPPDVSLKNLDLTTKGGFYVSEASNDTDENGITSTFTVRLSSQPGDNDTSTADNVTITVSVSDSTEAELVSDSSLVFTESNWNAAQTVTVRGLADNLSDGDQSYTVILKDNVTSDARYRYVDPPDVSLKNLDLTTKGGFYVSEASNDTDENGITSTFTVRLSSQPGDNDTSTADNVTITVSVSDSTEAELVSDSSLVFTESNWNAAQTVTVRGIADNLSDGDQSYTVILKDNVTSDARYRYVDPPDVSLKNLDLTTKGGFYVSEASNDTDENGITSTFTVRLSSQPGDNDTSTADNVTITVSVSDSTEAELVSDSSLVFTEQLECGSDGDGPGYRRQSE